MGGRRAVACWVVAAAAAVLALPGCGGGLKTYPVRGKVVFEDGDVRQLADCHIELVREGDPAVRPSGLIGPDGRFEVQTLYSGKVLRGAPEGKYQARIVLPSGDDDRPERHGKSVHSRFLDPSTSGLSLQVPAAADLVVTVSSR